MENPPRSRSVGRDLLALGLPAFATLISEPLMLLADSAMIGHVGTTELAGLGLAGSVLTTIVGLCVFLAYGTTGTVARRLGAGDRRAALESGVDGLALASLIGVAIVLAAQLGGRAVLGLYGASEAVTDQAVRYFSIASIGILPLLLILASTGVLRGLQDTRTPLYVAITVNLSNIALNFALIYGAGLGITGAAIGTLVSQSVGAGILLVVVLRGARRYQARLRPQPGRVLVAARTGSWLFLRTLSLQAGVLFATVIATRFGAVGLGAHQVTAAIFSFLAFALDALAIAAQAIVGKALGAGDARQGRELVRIGMGWGLVAGVVFGLLLFLGRGVIPPLFTPDPQVQAVLAQTLLMLALAQPIAGVVFLLDGVLIGAGDARYLALAGVIALICYLPLAALVAVTDAGVGWLWAAWGGYLLARLITLWVRARGDAWLRLGV
ncbi:MATE family efflux transporter [Naumannella halotolerans]|uniref:MATE family efflux transporter n=1 Tax=Naumannella halotolerans TaxID=993414 RepID=UPI00370DB036